MAQTDTTGQLSWLLDNLVNQVEHVQQALILSRDGHLPIISPPAADRASRRAATQITPIDRSNARRD